MNRITLDWLCSTLGADFTGKLSDEELGSLSFDSRTIQPGEVFWAIRARRDGHDFVQEALTRGARFAVTSKEWKRSAAGRIQNQLIGVDDTLKALTAAARDWRKKLRAPVIAITGSNGKTTTKDYLIHLLQAKYKTAGTAGNLNNELGVPLSLLGMEASSEAIVLEMGATKEGDIRFLCDVANPDHGLVTSISAAHLEGFGSIDGVARAKGELYEHVRAHGAAFVPLGDNRCIAASASAKKRIGFGFESSPAPWKDRILLGEGLEFDRNACANFVVKNNPVKLAVPGKPAALACLAAITVAQFLGVPLTLCAKRAATAPLTGGRATVYRFGRLTVIDDSYNANPMSVRAALDTLQRMPGDKKIAVLGDMNELGGFSRDEHIRLGESLGLYSLNHIYLVGKEVYHSALRARELKLPVTHFKTRDELESRISDIAANADVLLIKASRSLGLDQTVQKLRMLIA